MADKHVSFSCQTELTLSTKNLDRVKPHRSSGVARLCYSVPSQMAPLRTMKALVSFSTRTIFGLCKMIAINAFIFWIWEKAQQSPSIRALAGSTLKPFRPQDLARPGAEERDRRELHPSMRLILGAGGWGKLDTGGKCDAKTML